MRILLTTILMLVCLVAYSATPSYSNFSSNQFAPSGTYTVTVKNQPKLTNIIEHAQLSLTNPAFANSLIYITNMTGTNGLTNTMVFVSYYGPQVQFSWMTNGIGSSNISMVISNGMVGIGKGNPAYALDVIGQITSSLNMNAGADMNVGAIAGGNSKVNFSSRAVMFSPAKSYITLFENTFVTNGGAIIFPASTNVLSTHETATNTVIGSQGTNLWIGDGITADATYGQFRQFSFQTSGTPVMVISNGLVGIGKANPTVQVDVIGDIKSGGSVTGNNLAGNSLSAVSTASLLSINAGRSDFSSSGLNINGSADGKTRLTIGYDGTLMICAVATQSVTNDNATNTVLISQGTNLYIGDGITANSSNVATMQFSFQTSGTPVMVISNGFVGIGKANPATALDVVGTVTIGGTDVRTTGGTLLVDSANYLRSYLITRSFNSDTNAALNGATIDTDLSVQYTNAAGAVTFTGLSSSVNVWPDKAKRVILYVDTAAAGTDITVTVPVSWKSHTPGTTYYVTNGWIGRFDIIKYGTAFTNLTFELIK